VLEKSLDEEWKVELDDSAKAGARYRGRETVGMRRMVEVAIAV